MNSRRFTGNFSRALKRKIALREAYCTAGIRRSFCRLWVVNCGRAYRSHMSTNVRFAPKATFTNQVIRRFVPFAS
jgi:hypothetical protein